MVYTNSPPVFTSCEEYLSNAPTSAGATDDYLHPTHTPAGASCAGCASQRDEAQYESIPDHATYENVGVLNIV